MRYIHPDHKALLCAWMRPATALLVGCGYALILGGMLGCSTDDNTGAPPQNDAGIEDTDGVDPGDPLERAASVEVTIHPARATYNPDTVIQVGARILDGFGELIP